MSHNVDFDSYIKNTTLLSFSFFQDSVVCVKFNHDGSLLATGDMSGYIQVWKVEGATKTWDFETGDLSVSRKPRLLHFDFIKLLNWKIHISVISLFLYFFYTIISY